MIGDPYTYMYTWFNQDVLCNSTAHAMINVCPASKTFFRHSRPLVKIKIVRMSNEKDMKELSKLLGGMNMPPGALALNFAVWTGRNEQDDARFKFKPHSSGRRLRTPF